MAVHEKGGLSRKHVSILGVKVSSNLTTSLLRQIEVDIKNKYKFYIVTPNPEIVMAAQEDEALMDALNKADVSIPDGIGIIAAHRFLTLPNPGNYFTRFWTLLVQGMGVGFSIFFDRRWLMEELDLIRGRELFFKLIQLANRREWRVYLLGGENGEAVGTKKILEASFKKVVFRARQGPMLFNDGTPKSGKEAKEEEETIKDIDRFGPDLLFVCFDFRKQEKWLYRHYKKLNIGGGMVLGGTFKYVTGLQKLPPKFVADYGLEWLWRLLSGSQKGRRVINAFPKFPLKIFLYKLSL